MIIFKITDAYIELNRLLKVLNIAESGGQANQLIEDGLVSVNGNQEFRKRNKLKPGDKISVHEFNITIEHGQPTEPES